MKWKECKHLINACYTVGGGYLSYLITNASFKVTFWFRIGNYLKSKNNKVAKITGMFVYWLQKHYQLLTGIQLPIGTEIGGGITFPHFSGIVITSSAVIGKHCTILQGVTIGNMRTKVGDPVIGDNCVLFAGAKVIGPVKIGNNVVVGAGAVVVHDVPDNSVVVGVPAKVVSHNSLEILKHY